MFYIVRGHEGGGLPAGTCNDVYGKEHLLVHMRVRNKCVLENVPIYLRVNNTDTKTANILQSTNKQGYMFRRRIRNTII
jgi:hypothetical protein